MNEDPITAPHDPTAWSRLRPGGSRLSALQGTRSRVVAALAIAGLLAGGGWLVLATGGTRTALLHLLYLPVLAAAWVFGIAGGVLAGVAAGLVVGPVMPLDADAGIAQHPANWLYRLGFFTLIGAASGAAARALTRQLERLRATEARFGSVVENAADMMLVHTPDGTVGYASPSTRRVLGHAPEELVGADLRDVIHPSDIVALLGAPDADACKPGDARTPTLLELRARHSDGAWRHLEATVTDLRADPSIMGILLVGRDVTERRTMEAQLLHQALHDPLTGLANRTLFVERLGQTVAEDSWAGVTVLCITLERVRAVRDTYGHDAGDRVVCTVAERLQARLRHHDLLSRHDGAELAMSCPGVADPADAMEIAQRLLEQVREPVLVADDEVFVSASVGVRTVRHAGAHHPGELLRDAGTAMRYAANQGGDRADLYTPRRRVQAASQLRTRSALARALDRGELRVHYQPIVSLADYRARGCEALLRWQHPTLGLVPPSEFVPIAEQTGVIVPIGAWVLEQATAQLRAWQRALPEAAPEQISVNLSPRQLTDDNLLRTVSRALHASGLDPGCLTLEVTETMLVGDEEMRERLQALEALGVRIAIDDFGTGYSALGYLQNLPADSLKIDRSFVRDIGAQDDDPVVTAVIGLAHRLGLGTVAEGVETTGQAERLTAWGCQQAQGYLFARPQEAETVQGLLGRELLAGSAVT